MRRFSNEIEGREWWLNDWSKKNQKGHGQSNIVAVICDVMCLLWWDAADGGGGIDDRKGGAGTESIGEGEWWEEKGEVKVARPNRVKFSLSPSLDERAEREIGVLE